MAPNRVSKAAQPTARHSQGGGGSVFNQPRREFSARTKRLAWERANGYCEGWIADIGRCNMPLDRGHHFDHIDPDWFSKDGNLENCQVICRHCHKLKTRLDIRNIAKSKRVINKRIKAKKSKRRFGSQSIFGSGV